MEEDGTNVARHTSNHSEAYARINFDCVINISANKNCSFFATREKNSMTTFSIASSPKD
ncbi:MAG: hypothetical protein H7199_01715 [Burkholderiales bacterium]|nr:hypothetical protein [Flavobacterium sp.]